MISCILVSIASIAAVMDLVRERIDNHFIAACWILGAGYQAGSHGFEGIGLFLTGSVVPIVLLYLLFRFRMLGAGDIKLLSASHCTIVSFCNFGGAREILIRFGCRDDRIGINGHINPSAFIILNKQL